MKNTDKKVSQFNASHSTEWFANSFPVAGRSINPLRPSCFSFSHWVWVYGVEPNDADGDRVPDPQYRDSLNQPYSTVHFTYTHPSGQNLFNVDHPEWRPTHYNVGGPRQSVYMPWFSGFTEKDTKYISTTELIWYWHASDYNPTGSLSPSATTRYYDGSP